MLKTLGLALFGLLLSCGAAAAVTCPTWHTLTNGTTASATDVMDNFGVILNCPDFLGNVGIGTASPSTKLHIYAGSSGGSPYDPNNTTWVTLESNYRAVVQFLAPSTSDSEGFFFGTQVTPLAGQFMFQPNSSSFYWYTPATGEEMMLTSAGYLGIGTTTPALPLTVAGNIRIGASGTLGCVQNYAGATLTGTCSSDARLKDITRSVTGVLERFSRLQLVRYRWNRKAASLYHNSTSVLNTGFIAQAVQRQFPELVSFDRKGYRQLDYSTLSLYGLEAIKELKAANDRQAVEIVELHRLRVKEAADIEQLKTQLATLQRRVNVRTARN